MGNKGKFKLSRNCRKLIKVDGETIKHRGDSKELPCDIDHTISWNEGERKIRFSSKQSHIIMKDLNPGNYRISVHAGFNISEGELNDTISIEDNEELGGEG